MRMAGLCQFYRRTCLHLYLLFLYVSVKFTYPINPKFCRCGNAWGSFWAFFTAHAQKRPHFYFRSKVLCHHYFRRPQFPINGVKFPRSGVVKGVILGIFNLRMRRNGHISTSGQRSDVIIVSADSDVIANASLFFHRFRHFGTARG